MALSLRRGVVTSIGERVDGLVRLEVDGRPCIAYPRLTGPVEVGDDVVVNVQAVELGLGSGGFDVLHANLTRGLGLAPEEGAHVMKLPYTSLQHAVRHAEEDTEVGLGGALDLPVVCCSLHSQLAPAVAGLREGTRTAYVQLAGGALPVSLSDAVRALKERGLVEVAVAAGPCVDGDVACVSVPAALVWAAKEGYDVVICAVGPGVAGTGTQLGHGALSVVEALNSTALLEGEPVLALRVSEVDGRERHRGVSHHSRAILDLTAGPVNVAWPRGLTVPDWLESYEEVDVDDWREVCEGLPLSHMGRGPEEDPWFFAAAFAGGRLASRLG